MTTKYVLLIYQTKGYTMNTIKNNDHGLDLDYWKERCLLAEAYISESPCDPDITAEQLEAYNKWKASHV